jgi:hypothetical protein
MESLRDDENCATALEDNIGIRRLGVDDAVGLLRKIKWSS